jgi:hypothetical protein
MACGGLKFLEKDIKTKNKNYTERVLDLALDMMRCVETNTFDMGVKLTLKIGVHHGNCTYGVIGYHKPQFSLMGDTVNTTSRHCTTGDPGCIVLSFAAQARINHSKYPNLQKKSVSMKGKGALDVYMLNKDAIQKINNPTFFGEHVVNNPLNNIIEPGKHPLSKESPSSELAGKRQVQNRRGTDGNKPGFFSPMGQSGSLSNPFAIQPIAVNNDSLHHSVLRNQTQNKTEPPKEPIPQLVTESDGDFTDRALNNTNRGPLSQPDQLHSLKSRNPLDLELTPTNAMKQASSPNFVKSDEDILRNVKRAATFAHSESKAESLADVSIEELQDSESDNEMELKNEQTEKITNIMKSCAGYLYGFRKEKFSLEKFYNKQMRIKYKWKVKKTLVVITAMIFVQEVLLWISFTLGEGVDQVRIGFFAWVFPIIHLPHALFQSLQAYCVNADIYKDSFVHSRFDSRACQKQHQAGKERSIILHNPLYKFNRLTNIHLNRDLPSNRALHPKRDLASICVSSNSCLQIRRPSIAIDPPLNPLFLRI